MSAIDLIKDSLKSLEYLYEREHYASIAGRDSVQTAMTMYAACQDSAGKGYACAFEVTHSPKVRGLPGYGPVSGYTIWKYPTE